MFHCTRVKNYRTISFLSVVGKICAGILVDRVCKVTEGLIDDERWSFRARKEYAYQIFILKQIYEKAREKHVEFMQVLYIWRQCTIRLIWKFVAGVENV